MAAAANAPGQINGLTPLPNELAEYERILKLCDEIFAGVHPRLKVPAHAVRKVAPLPAQTSAIADQSAAAPAPAAALRVPGLDLSKPIGDVATSQPVSNGHSTKPPSPPLHQPAVGGLDAIFLTKSDELVKAEIQLQRQRLEKQLREQAEHKRNEARSKATVAEAKPDFDVTEVYESALELVKPLTLSEIQEAHANASTSDSFDSHSFYSSRAPDSTPEDGEDRMARARLRRAQAHGPVDVDDAEGDIRLRDISDDAQQAGHRGMHPPALGRHDSRAYGTNYQQPQDPSDRYSPPDAQVTAYDDLDDEPEYSPPEPSEPMLAYPVSSLSKSSHKRRSSGRIPDPQARRDSPSAEVRIVRNTITSPIAPQPARLSSLAQTKTSPMLQNRRQGADIYNRRQNGIESERTSPEMQTLPRKRRKVQDGRKARGNQRRGANSPVAAIKDEPVSPPPFHDVPPLGTGGGQRTERVERPAYIEIDTPPEPRYVPVERPPEYRLVSAGVDGSPGRLSTVRSVSRPIYREVVRDTQDLRRVASLQNMQAGYQPEYIRQSSAYPEQPLARAPSYATIDRQPVRAASVMYEVPPTTRQYASDLTPTSPLYRKDYVVGSGVMAAPPSAPVPQPQPQPQRRIIVDEAGNRYYETITAPREVSMAPPSRPVIRDPYDNRPTQYIRAASVFEAAPPRETRYLQEMAPPPPLSARASVAPRAEGYERPVYASHDSGVHLPVQHGNSVQVVEYQPRQQQVYMDDRYPPREEYVSMTNARPPEPYIPERTIQRMSSVRPGERSSSVFHDDRLGLPQEYVRVNPPHYAPAPPPSGAGYYPGPELNPAGLDGTREIRYSVVPQQRY